MKSAPHEFLVFLLLLFALYSLIILLLLSIEYLRDVLSLGPLLLSNLYGIVVQFRLVLMLIETLVFVFAALSSRHLLGVEKYLSL